MADEFAPGNIPIQGAADIPSAAQRTVVEDNTSAQMITALGNTALEAGKGFLKNKAIRDSNAALQGEDDFLKSEVPSEIRPKIDEYDKGIGRDAEAVRQGATTRERALLNADAAIRQAESVMPGWADEVRKSAVRHLGYDPGGLAMKSILQRENQEFTAQMARDKSIRSAGFNPDNQHDVEAFDNLNRATTIIDLEIKRASLDAGNAKGNTAKLGAATNRAFNTLNAGMSESLSSMSRKMKGQVPDPEDTVAMAEWTKTGQQALLAEVTQAKRELARQASTLALAFNLDPAKTDDKIKISMDRLNDLETLVKDVDRLGDLKAIAETDDINQRRSILSRSPELNALYVLGDVGRLATDHTVLGREFLGVGMVKLNNTLASISGQDKTGQTTPETAFEEGSEVVVKGEVKPDESDKLLMERNARVFMVMSGMVEDGKGITAMTGNQKNKMFTSFSSIISNPNYISADPDGLHRVQQMLSNKGFAEQYQNYLITKHGPERTTQMWETVTAIASKGTASMVSAVEVKAAESISVRETVDGVSLPAEDVPLNELIQVNWDKSRRRYVATPIDGVKASVTGSSMASIRQATNQLNASMNAMTRGYNSVLEASFSQLSNEERDAMVRDTVSKSWALDAGEVE